MLSYRRDERPSDYEYALMSQTAYSGGELLLAKGAQLNAIEGRDWRVYDIKMHTSGYGGIIFRNRRTNQVVVAYKGNDYDGSIWDDFNGTTRHLVSPQEKEAYEIAQIAIELAIESHAHLSFTGYALGAYLAELSLFYSYANEQANDEEGYNLNECTNAVTFESPGSYDAILERVQSFPGHAKVEINKVDIVHYLSYPNKVNTCNQHFSTIYSMAPNTHCWVEWAIEYFFQIYGLENIVHLFALAPHHQIERMHMLAWPRGEERTQFLGHVTKGTNGDYQWRTSLDVVQSCCKTRYANYLFNMPLSYWSALPIRHFLPATQAWLEAFFHSFSQIEKGHITTLLSQWKNEFHLESSIIRWLTTFNLIKSCKDETVVCVTDLKRSATQMRTWLSCWLADNPLKAGQVLDGLQNILILNQKQSNITVTLMESGSQLTQGGCIKNSRATGISVHFSQDTEEIPQNLQTLYPVINEIAQSGIKISVTGIGKGANVMGSIEGLSVEGISLSIQGNSEILTPSEPTPANSLLAQRWAKQGIASSASSIVVTKESIKTNELPELHEDEQKNIDSRAASP